MNCDTHIAIQVYDAGIRVHEVMHYSARRSDVEVRERMIRDIRAGLGGLQ